MICSTLASFDKSDDGAVGGVDVDVSALVVLLLSLLLLPDPGADDDDGEGDVGGRPKALAISCRDKQTNK